ncbi:MAG: adenosylmethionine--8-amino-7-oxononanoate transaminase [Hyphomicrobium sp.]|nr:adenosylmethionine--8-amino-7-oxononanoate transaminase [Hyphomicrobium sp.]
MTPRSPVWHPFTQHAIAPPPLEIARTEGAYLSTADGRRIFDGISSWWVVTHSHREPRIMTAIRKATEDLDQVIFAGFTHRPAETLAHGLVDLVNENLAIPDGDPARLAHVFYSDSGSTAVEVGLKMALGYWFNIGRPRRKIVALEHAYHGDTVGTMSAGARGIFNAPYAPMLFDVERIPFPARGREHDTLDALARAVAGGDVAALIVEPLVLGAGGMLMYAPDMLARMADVCRTSGTLLIADEVMTGWGRTGTLLASSQAGVRPDILCLAKGITGGTIPLAATLATDAIFEAHYSEDRRRTFFHSSSYTANPIACAAAVANLDIWRNEPVGQRISALADAQESRLAHFRDDARFENVRRMGTIAALDLKARDAGYLAGIGPRLYAFFLERDILLRPLGNTIYVMPPFCTTGDDLDRVYDTIAAAAEALV